MARIVFLTSSYPSSPGDGVCGYVDDLARVLAETHGHAVRVLAPEDGARLANGGDGAASVGAASVEVERVSYPWFGRRRFLADADLGDLISTSRLAAVEAAPFTLAYALRARRAVRDADLICSHWLVPSGVVGAWLRRASRPHVTVAHGGDVHLLERLAGGRTLARWVLARSDRVVAVSRNLAERISRVAPEAETKLDVVPMGASLGPPSDPGDVARFRDEFGADGRTVALFLGRLARIKGVDTLVEAAARVPSLALWIAGDGPEEAQLREQAQQARLHVSFLGRVDRRRRRIALDACDVVVLPSRVEGNGRVEGSPVVCAESYAAGRPVIGTRTGGLVEAIQDGQTGMLVDPDDPKALAAAIERFTVDGDLRARLARGAREAGAAASIETTAARFDRIVGDLVESRGAGGDPECR